MENNVVMLNDVQRERLESFAKNGVHNAHLITRARVVLLLDRSQKKEHLRITRICERVGISRRAVYDIRDSFLKAASVEEFLTRKKRETPPVPPKITGEVEARIIALACSKAPEGHARWTVRLLGKKAVELKIVESIGATAIHGLLKKRNISLT